MVGGMLLDNPPPHPPDNTALRAKADKSSTKVLLVVAVFSGANVLFISYVLAGSAGSWIADWSGIHQGVLPLVWLLFVLLVIVGFIIRWGRVKARLHHRGS